MSITHDNRVEMYKRQLGGTTAALNRSRQNEKALINLVHRMYEELPETSKFKFSSEVKRLSRSK